MNEIRKLLLNTDRQLPSADRATLLALGEAAVPTLIEILADRTLQASKDDAESMAAIHAADILGDLRAVAAIAALLKELLSTEPGYILFDAALFALEAMGAAVVEPALALLPEAAAEEKSSVASVLSRAGVRDPRILALLLEQLQLDAMLGAMHLGHYGDPAALPALIQVFDTTELDGSGGFFGNQALFELEASIRDLGGVLHAEQTAKFEEALAPRNALRQQMLRGMEGKPAPPKPINLPPNQPKQPPIYTRTRPGRNDGCWCGSGKKYKKCHLWDDESAP